MSALGSPELLEEGPDKWCWRLLDETDIAEEGGEEGGEEEFEVDRGFRPKGVDRGWRSISILGPSSSPMVRSSWEFIGGQGAGEEGLEGKNIFASG